MNRCEQCNSERVTQSVGSRAFDYGLDSTVMIKGILVIKCKQCGEESIVLPRPLELMNTLASTVARSPERLTPKEIRFLRRFLDLTQSDLGGRLGGIEQETISRWETGSQPMGEPAERLLRLFSLAEASGQSDLVAKVPNQLEPATTNHKPVRLRVLNGHWAA